MADHPATPPMRYRGLVDGSPFKDVVPPDPESKTSYPPQRAVEHEIEIIPGNTPPVSNYYKQSPDKDRETCVYLDQKREDLVRYSIHPGLSSGLSSPIVRAIRIAPLDYLADNPAWLMAAATAATCRLQLWKVDSISLP
eukprot:87999-Chlamydomonas_euryale.AAC.1